MKTLKLAIAGSALALAAAANAASPDPDDRMILDAATAKVVSAKADADVAKYGGTQLDQAEAALDDLRKNLEEDDATDSERPVRQIDAPVATQKIPAKSADLKDSPKDRKSLG